MNDDARNAHQTPWDAAGASQRVGSASNRPDIPAMTMAQPPIPNPSSGQAPLPLPLPLPPPQPQQHSGLSSYSPISTLERQYDFKATVDASTGSALPSRFVVFVTVLNCQVPGGVAGLLRMSKDPSSSRPLNDPDPGAVSGPGPGLGATHPPVDSSRTLQDDGEFSDDPFSFLGEDSQHGSAAFLASGGDDRHQRGGGAGAGGVSSLWKRAVKGATSKLERGIHTLAIRADQGRSRDWYTLGAYDATTGALLGRTESVQLSQTQQQDDAANSSVAIAFSIPVVIPSRASTVVLKMWVRSGATLLQTAKASRNFFLGQTVVAASVLAGLARGPAPSPLCQWPHPLPLQSSALKGASLALTVLTPDPKFPPLCAAGWSLSDPTLMAPSASAGRELAMSSLYNLPLDQSYGWGTSEGRSLGPSSSTKLRRVIAVERSIESTVVLPIASAFATLASAACQRSVEHAKSALAALDAGSGEGAFQVHIVSLNLADPSLASIGSSQPLQPAPPASPPPPIVSASWQRPDSVLEVELLRPTSWSPDGTTPSFHVSPTPCHPDRVLPSLAAKYGSTLSMLVYLVGSIRFQIVVRLPRARSDAGGGVGHYGLEHVPVVVPQHNPFDPVTSMSSIREHVSQDQVSLTALVALEQFVQEQTTPAGIVRRFPVTNPVTGQEVGTIAIRVGATTPGSSASASTVALQSADGGLVSLVGLAPLCPGIQPSLDFDPVDPQSLSDSALQRQLYQLKTLGNFVSRAYLEQHISTMREAEARLVADRATAYRQALVDQVPKPLGGFGHESHQDRSPKPFRPSSSRSTTLLSGIPFNVHTCSVALITTTNQPESAAPPAEEALYNTSCGAPADHAKDFGNVFTAASAGGGVDTVLLASPVGGVSGGLRRLEIKRQEVAGVVAEAQAQIVSLVAQCFASQRQSGQPATHVPSNHPDLPAAKAKLVESVQALHHITWICATRRASVFSQALGIAATTYLGSLSDASRAQSSVWPEVWSRHGYLISFEGLLSAAGKELGMIEDAFVGIAMLRMVSIVLVRDDGNVSPTRVVVPSSPYVRWVELSTSGQHSSRQFTLRIGIIPSYYEQRVPVALRNNVPVRLHSLLFEVGVDIRQWGANTGTSVLSQLEEQRSSLFVEKSALDHDDGTAADGSDIASPTGGMIDEEDDDVGVRDDDVLVQLNYEGFRLLNAYAYLVAPSPAPTSNRVHPLLETLHQHILGSAGKMNHNILVEAASLCRQLGGGAAVFCKSGKDRTAMHVTYKQAAFIRQYRDQHLASHEDASKPDHESTLEIASLLRTYGTRLPICEKNVGQAKYAFNSLQVKFMPETLKPPMNTLAGFLKGGKLFEGGGIES